VPLDHFGLVLVELDEARVVVEQVKKIPRLGGGFSRRMIMRFSAAARSG
jgi:hypothetical protein